MGLPRLFHTLHASDVKDMSQAVNYVYRFYLHNRRILQLHIPI